MTKSETYRAKLKTLKTWDAFLLKESGLPGPRGNLELAQVVADLGDEALFTRYLAYDAARAPVNSPYEFLAFCGVVGLGRLVAEGKHKHIKTIRACASDARWRMREGVAMALQRWGDADMDTLIAEMEKWSAGNLLEQRAAIAALCEPRLLRDETQVARVLAILDRVTDSIRAVQDRKRDEFVALKKGLAYCWSVAVAASPNAGKRAMEKWFTTNDRDIIWIMRENLKKNRLARMDSSWVTQVEARLEKLSPTKDTKSTKK
ncbi:MAG: hypothetical protein HY868_14615 [Chloroflexi bacterium]|nr:hypothetical protein [Chloroflexota bacterium]